MVDSLAVFALLFPAARADFRAEHHPLLTTAAGNFSGWDGFIAAVEQHGMGPLFFEHAGSAGIALPEEVSLQLKGLVIRHRMAARVRIHCLTEIMQIAHRAGIQVLLLKGAAVSVLAYSQPGLRPMRDIDLLCTPADARRLHELLREAGYRVSEEVPWDHHHLASLAKPVEGFQVNVEIHHHLFHFSWRGKTCGEAELLARARQFDLDGTPAWSLALEDQLWHTYRHMLSGPIRLMAVADLISLSERYASEIDWDLLADRHPQLLNSLALFHDHSPLSEQVVSAAGVERRNGHIPLGPDLQGWSNITSSQIKVIGLPRFLYLTFTPSDWWLYLYFGADQQHSIFWQRYFFYPADRLRLVWQRLARQIAPGSSIWRD